MSAVASEKSRLPLGRLKHLLGGNPSLMALPIGSKVPRKGSTYDSSTTDDEPTLNASNIAVRLGKKHGNICAIDFDGIESSDGKFIVNPDDLLEQFFRFNRHLRYSLRTKGRRGASVWVTVEGEYTSKVTHLTIPNHEGHVGELRCGQYSLIQGIHPDTGNPYKVLVDAPAFNISLGDITWLDGKPITQSLKMSTRRTEEQKNRRTENQMFVSLSLSGGEQGDCFKCCMSEVVKFRATRSGITNKVQFDLARRVKKIERDFGVKITPAQLMEIGFHWYDVSKAHLKKDETRNDYAMLFIQRYGAAHTPEGMTIVAAWEQAKKEASHAIMDGTHEHLKDLQKLFRKLAEMNGDITFFVNGNQVAELMGYKGSTETRWKRGRRDIAALEAFGVIIKDQVGRTGKSNTYRYLLDDLNTEAAA
jgi:hypothetical protein